VEPKPLLLTKELTKSFGGLVAVNRVNLCARERRITILIGPNGAGKTTLVNLCTGILRPDAGEVFFNGINITGWPIHRVYTLGLVRTFQIPQLFSSLTVLDNVVSAIRSSYESPLKALSKRFWEKEEEEHVREALRIIQDVGLGKYWDVPARELGAAHMKLLELARALASRAKMIVLDEPIGGVDPAFAHEILNHVRKIRDEKGIAFMIIEHRIDLVVPYADYAYCMAHGKIVAEGAPKDVINNPEVVACYIGG
jgi:branched-chain amino acid transport system ATP-binding protein